jgi:hypothetical protein
MIFILLLIILALLVFSPAILAQSTTPEGSRIIQPITVNGQSATGVLVVKNGTTQTYSCESPQPYVTQQSEQGWACYEGATGMWLLHSQPPSDIAAAEPQEPPTAIYSEPNNVYVPLPYSYPYYPYAYGYPYYWGSPFGLGFAFNFGHGFHDGHHGEFHGGHGFAHGGPAFHGGGGFHGGGFHGGGFHGGGFGGHMGGGGRR